MPIAAGSLLRNPTSGMLVTDHLGNLLTANGTSDHCCCGCATDCSNCTGTPCTKLCITVTFTGIGICTRCLACIDAGPSRMEGASGTYSGSVVLTQNSSCCWSGRIDCAVPIKVCYPVSGATYHAPPCATATDWTICNNTSFCGDNLTDEFMSFNVSLCWTSSDTWSIAASIGYTAPNTLERTFGNVFTGTGSGSCKGASGLTSSTNTITPCCDCQFGFANCTGLSSGGGSVSISVGGC